MSFAIAEQVVVRSVGVYDGGEPEVTYVVKNPKAYPTRVAAKVAFMVALDPDLRGAPDVFVVRHFDKASRNQGYFKAVKVTP